MKSIVVFLLLAIATSAQAQLTNRVLVVAKSGIDASTMRLVDAVKQNYDGVVSIDTKLPDVLGYDAVLLVADNSLDVLLDSIEQARLIDFVKAGGRFFAQGNSFRTQADHKDDTTDNQLWNFIGDSSESWASSGLHIDSVYGVPGTFMAGLSVAQPYDPLRLDFPELLIRRGMHSVIGAIGNFGVSLAWTSIDPKIKAALLWPIGTGYYEEFISTLVCTYFQLCELDVAESIESPLALRYDQQTRSLQLPGPGEVVISDILGRVILQFDAEVDELRLGDLATGTFLVGWRSGHEQASLVFQKQ